jgi:hypothetical protein
VTLLGTVREPRARPAHRASLALAIAVCAVLLVGVWGAVLLYRAAAAPVDVGTPVTIDGGTVVVHGAEPEQLGHNPGMPAGMMADHLPEGRQRLTLSLTLTATEGDGLAYGPDLLDVSAAEGPVTVARSDIPSGRLDAGQRLELGLVLETPDPVAELLVAFGDARVRVQPSAGPGHTHDHGE